MFKTKILVKLLQRDDLNNMDAHKALQEQQINCWATFNPMMEEIKAEIDAACLLPRSKTSVPKGV